jgi:Holliday junction resolvase RusA-like endonuclease
VTARDQNQDSDANERSSWNPLSYDRLPTGVRANLESEFPNGSELRDWVISEFEKQSGSSFDPATWSDDTATLFRRWWWFQLEKGDFIFRKRPVLQQMLHPSLFGKANALSQRHCRVCSGLLPSDAQFPISIIPIRIAPQSRQSLDKVDWAAFQAAVKTWFSTRTLDLGPSRHLCIAVTYVLSVNRNDRDLDNMTKALMDAFSRALDFDDRDIHHLDILKMIGETTEEYVIIRVAPSYLNDNSTVMVPIFDGAWAVGEPLALGDFVNQA